MWANLTKDSMVTYPVKELPKLAKDGKNKFDFFCPDVMKASSFGRNYGGHPRSDVALINEQSNLQAAQAMFNQLPQYNDNANTSGMTDAEILLQHKSKYCQTASEQVLWLEDQIHQADLKREFESQSKSDLVQFDHSDAEIVENT